MDPGDRTPLFNDRDQTTPKSAAPEAPTGGGDARPLYHAQSQSPTNKLMQLAFVCVVILMVLITVVLTIVRTVTRREGGLYFMLGLSLVGFVVLEIFMILFVRRGELPAGKSWFLYFVGGCVLLESVFTDVLLYQ